MNFCAYCNGLSASTSGCRLPSRGWWPSKREKLRGMCELWPNSAAGDRHPRRFPDPRQIGRGRGRDGSVTVMGTYAILLDSVNSVREKQVISGACSVCLDVSHARTHAKPWHIYSAFLICKSDTFKYWDSRIGLYVYGSMYVCNVCMNTRKCVYMYACMYALCICVHIINVCIFVGINGFCEFHAPI